MNSKTVFAIMETSHTYTCKHCQRGYKRKLYYDRHVLACQMLSKDPKTLKQEAQERADTPTVRQLYDLVLELGIKYAKMEKKLDELSKWADSKKRKLCVVDWLNDNCIPNEGFYAWKDAIDLEMRHLDILFEHDYVNGMLYILQELLPLASEAAIPIKAFDQKENTLFIYQDDGWIVMSPSEFDSLLGGLSKTVMGFFVKWQEANKHKLNRDDFSVTFTENVQKAIGGNFTKEQIHSRIRRGLYKHLKMNLRNIVQYEFTF